MTSRKTRLAEQAAQKLDHFIYDKWKQGVIARHHIKILSDIEFDVLEKQGYLDDEAFAEFVVNNKKPVPGVTWHATHLVKAKLLELYPQLENELNNLLSNRSR